MRIGILETGEVSPELRNIHGSYGEMFQNLISEIYRSSSFKKINIIEGQFPNNQLDADLWVITGSKYGVYDRLSWINPLKKFILSCVGKNVPVFGVCFGHQILAEALGGKVKKFQGGWGLGVHKYEIVKSLHWTQLMGKSFSSYAIHQDQIVTPPEDSINVAKSDFCNFALLAYGNIDRPYAISIQSHPEISSQYLSDLIKRRRQENVFPTNTADLALKTLKYKVDNKIITGSILKALCL